jgi:hypothetical protein
MPDLRVLIEDILFLALVDRVEIMTELLGPEPVHRFGADGRLIGRIGVEDNALESPDVGLLLDELVLLGLVDRIEMPGAGVAGRSRTSRS